MKEIKYETIKLKAYSIFMNWAAVLLWCPMLGLGMQLSGKTVLAWFV